MSEPDLSPRLTAGGQIYQGWTGLRIVTSLEHAASQFSLEVTERGGPAGGIFAALSAGQHCVVSLGTAVVITGWIDAVTRSVGPDAHSVTLTGRDATADLVDCAAEVQTYQDQTILAIAQDQLSHFTGPTGAAMPVSMSAGTDPGATFGKVAVEPGETVFELLDRLARARGLLLMPDQSGGLLIGRPGGDAAPAALIEGRNLTGLRGTDDWRDRYSDYIVRDQSAGSDAWHGSAAAAMQATAQDPEVAAVRHRPCVIRGESGETDLQPRADWAARVARARGRSLGLGVQGWAVGGRLWRAGQTAHVEAPSLGVSGGSWIIRGCTYSLDGQGTRTDLDLVPPGAFDPGPPTAEPSPT